MGNFVVIVIVGALVLGYLWHLINKIDYEDLARNPDQYIGESISFKGQILQVIRYPKVSRYRIAINKDPNSIMMIKINNSQLKQRILVNDQIEFEGKFTGEFTYDAKIQGSVTIPSASVDKFWML